ncbi:MAG: hypothetical protein Q8910_18215 [Bacteroidota bacterium]|nr:hypothetical protein [Bacteroidota bacterium]
MPFKDTVADDYFSTRWYIRQYEAISSEKLSGVKEIAERAVKEEKPWQLFEEFGINLGEFMVPG